MDSKVSIIIKKTTLRIKKENIELPLTIKKGEVASLYFLLRNAIIQNEKLFVDGENNEIHSSMINKK